jgi:hypothetical protein
VVGITARSTDADATTNGVTYALVDSDGNVVTTGSFQINVTTGVVTVAAGAVLDYETAASHEIIVQATSQDGSSSNQTFTINVSDLDETMPNIVPAVEGMSYDTVPEGAATGTWVGQAYATDPNAGDTLTYSLVDVNGMTVTDGPFQIDPTTGVVTVRDGSLVDFETATSHQIRCASRMRPGRPVKTALSSRLATWTSLTSRLL